MRRNPWICLRMAMLLLAVIGAGGLKTAVAQLPDPDVGASQPEGVQVLTRGPIHEAFAEPVVFDPKPSPVVPKEPPPPVEELPPSQKPDGDNVVWVPGYWAWDDSRTDFVWVSGLWRDIPPGQQWMPGYWSQAGGGFRWVPGTWVPAATQSVQYLPAPPPSLESGPSSPPPSDGATWSPGLWVWQDRQYVWQPGFWVPYQADWAWVPSHSVWSPSGYMSVDGYWDRPMLQRGTPFAPVYFSQPLYRQSNFQYTPTIGLLTSALATSLFVRPSASQYYFGDYYGANNFQSGIYPWYSYHQSRYGYDPMFAQYAATNVRRDPQWLNGLQNEYRYRRDNPEARPPHTYAELRRVAARPVAAEGGGNQASINQFRHDLVVARPLSQIAANPPGPVRYSTIDDSRRRDSGRQAVQFREFREQRLSHEAGAERPAPAATLPPNSPPATLSARRVELPRSPIAAAPRRESQGPKPPVVPTHPPLEPAARPRPQGEPHPLAEPHPDLRPQSFPGAGGPRGYVPGRVEPSRPIPSRVEPPRPAPAPTRVESPRPTPTPTPVVPPRPPGGPKAEGPGGRR